MDTLTFKAPEGALSSLKRWFPSHASTWGILLLCLLLSVPVLTVLSSVTASSEGVWQHLYETVLGDYVTHSVTLMVGVGLIVLVLGIGPAWLVTMAQFPGSRSLEWALVLPLAMPAYIIAYTYTGLLDVGGPVQAWIRETFSLRFGQYWFPSIRSLGGAITMLSLVLYPYVYLLSRTAFLTQGRNLIDAARTLGLTPWAAFIKVVLPVARPAVGGGVALVLMETLADFGAVSVFNYDTFTTAIYRTWYGMGNREGAAQLSMVLILTSRRR
jgi:iron(III) transport system permease protein